MYADLVKRAAAGGWTAETTDRDGRTVQWAKAYPDGSRASAKPYALDQEKASPPYTYSLIGPL